MRKLVNIAYTISDVRILCHCILKQINKVYSSNEDQKHVYIHADEKYITNNNNKITIGMLYKAV